MVRLVTCLLQKRILPSHRSHRSPCDFPKIALSFASRSKTIPSDLRNLSVPAKQSVPWRSMHYDRRVRKAESPTHKKALIEIHRSYCANMSDALGNIPTIHQIDTAHLEVDVLAIHANAFELKTLRNRSTMNPSTSRPEKRTRTRVPTCASASRASGTE